MKRKAFTLLELVMVIVVVGIISVSLLSRKGREPLYEAALQLVNHIRYTQHLALVNDAYSLSDSQWYKGRWQIIFTSDDGSDSSVSYTIYRDKTPYDGIPTSNEMAKNPANINRVMTGGFDGNSDIDITSTDFIGMKKLNLGLNYSVSSYSLENGCNGINSIAFDYQGRPIKGNVSNLDAPYAQGNTNKLITQDCHIVLNDGNEHVTIVVKPETGYVYIDNTL